MIDLEYLVKLFTQSKLKFELIHINLTTGLSLML